jgi:hypothetical protein
VREVRSEIGVLGGGVYGGGLVGRVASTEPRVSGRVRRGARRRTPCARESCNADSSPEPSASLCGEGWWGDKRRDAASSVPGMGLN